MTAGHVILSATDGQSACPRSVRRRLQAAWGPAPLANLTVAEGVNPESDLAGIDLVILCVCVDASTPAIREQIAMLHDAGIAVLALVETTGIDDPVYTHAGALVAPIDVDDHRLSAKVIALLHRQQEVRRLRQEVTVAHRFHGGLKGEIARMHDELQLAAMVQREFLPRQLPALMGVEFAALWRPAHYVSGDIYEVARLDDDHVGFFLADAVGHGVPAALMTMVISRSLTTKLITGSSYRILEPSEVLSRMNLDMIRRQGRTTRFATAVYGVINCRTRMMRLAGAGHPPPFLIGGDGVMRELETPGGLLGIFAEETYDQIEMPIAIGDRLLLYSDGFEQAFPDPRSDDYRRRLPTRRYEAEFLAASAAAQPEDVIQSIASRLDDQQGSLHQADDVTLLCMQAGPLVETPEVAAAGATRTAD
ncbi:MAG: PP2C family protein-serine/threonine phosphatase [Phycisphaerales bacterium]|nr:PP2C family protein-serine/threonine phosphatase [Phycisphaerae bacterium]NNF44432.1 PP2C family protein-serine/threonine phosphatase [Phycisphaerales bacterium]NNM26207.1 PP2C family protein-serine/threonine phosphatase [Phycisphaerales bacterium]